jgi:DNA-binding transcriptional regulator YiaG
MTPEAQSDYADLKRGFGLTKVELAFLTGVSRSMVQRWDPEPMWARRLLRAWRKDPDLLTEAREETGTLMRPT